MDKKFDTLLRQWKMLQLLPRRRKIDARTLQQSLHDDGFDVTIRTIQRDLQSLSSVFPIASDESKPIGWSWAEGGESFSIPGMDTTAALTLRMVDEYLSKLLPKSCVDSLSPHIERAKTILDQHTDNSLGEWPDKIRIIPRSMPLQPAQVAPHVLEVVTDALLDERRFLAKYCRRGESDVREYLVNPLALVVSDQVMYLVCTLREYDDIVLLAMHRFQEAWLTDKPGKRPKGFDLDAYLASGALGFPTHKPCSIKLKVIFGKDAATHLGESPLCEDQIMKIRPDGQVQVEAKVQDTQQLRWWLLGFGDQVEVLAPKTLRQEFAEKSARMAERYG
ncbi:helix-turn-helix transcriptional regulator [Desulfurispira natronophila]|uniref:Putative DNA-binding transcriptional regulator YafY n=1 Tax=Desulfurispira natronophila TaxID=682562 RepID=A0A7W7Y3V8_9BACT|nr:WYL domain-containing protein [Desulfurispira natronophila]MBB5021342.1 putative DNA-binding transcriptional regulator YafY [Desulfurispira natronophila]